MNCSLVRMNIMKISQINSQSSKVIMMALDVGNQIGIEHFVALRAWPRKWGALLAEISKVFRAHAQVYSLNNNN